MKTNLKFFLSLLFTIAAVLPVFALFPGNCLNFESGDFVSGNNIPANFNSGVTIEAWINHSSLSPNIQRYFTVLGENMVIRLDERRVDFYIKASSGVQYRIRPATQLVVGQWYHVAGTYNGTTMKLYVNGTLVGTETTSGGMTAIEGAFNIGNGAEPMIGKIDDVRLWNVVRSQQDIADHRFHELPIPQTGLRSYWRFDENNGNTAIDACGNSNGALEEMGDANRVASTLPLSFVFSGVISTNTTWTAPTVNVIGNVTINPSVTLTILPGVKVAVAPNCELEIKGNLIAEGTYADRITFTGTTPGSSWGGLFFNGAASGSSTNSKMKYCTVERGTGYWMGGNMYVVSYPLLQLENSIIRDGYAQTGGGIYQYHSHIEMIDCLVYNNTGLQKGGAFLVSDSDLKMTNCTVVNNASPDGGVMFAYFGLYPQPVIRNSIIRGNGSAPFTGSAGFHLNNMQYCNVEGGYQGTGNIDQDPGFSGEAANPYSLSGSSVCINAGTSNTAGLTMPASDLKGNPRIHAHSNTTYNRIDIGAYEYPGYLCPGNITASDGSNLYPGYVHLSWTFSPDYNVPIAGFRVLRDGIVVATTNSQTYSYLDYNALVGYIHLYRVESYYQSEAGLSIEDTGCVKPNGVISGNVKTTNNNPVMGVKLSLSPSVGKCLQFEAGNSSSISIGNPGLNLNQDFTVELWVKTLNTNVNLLDSGNHHLKIAAGKVVYTDGAHTLTQQDLALAVNDDSWHHIAVVSDATNNTVKMYLDSYQVAVATGYHFANNYTLANFAVPSGFTGYLDDIRLWAAVRDSSQVVDAMSIVVPGDSPNLKGYWAMNEGAGSTLFDATDYAHNAVVTGCTWSSNDPGMALGAITDGWGNYIITEIPYGSAITFAVTPSKPGHMFQPEQRLVTISSSNIAANNVDFTDNSMIPISGRVKFIGTDIPVINASIWLNGARALPPVATDSTGCYILEVEHGTPCIITVKFNDHVFNGYGNLGPVTYPRANVDFVDFFQTQLSVQVVGGSQSFPIGNYKITAKPVNDSYVYEKIFNADNSSDWSTGQVLISDLPPLNYNITIAPISGSDPFSLAVNTLFTKNKIIDLRNADAEGDTLRFEWRAPLQAEVAWDPALQMKYMTSDTLHEYGFYVMQQNVWQEAVITAFEDYNYGSYTDHIIPMLDCDINISNNVGSIPNNTANFEGENSYTYRFAPYLPHIVGGGNRPYQKKLEVTVTDPETERSAGNITWILTEGECPQESTYSSTSPEIPILVLHDPPGDGSYASFGQSSSHSFAMSASYASEEALGTQAQISLGLDVSFNMGILFSVETNLDFVFDMTLGFQASSSQENATTVTTTITTTEEYQTSSQDLLIGQASDLYVGGAVNLVWGLTKTLKWVDASNSVDLGQRTMLVPQGFNTWYIYTENQILNTVIPNLLAINKPVDAARWQSFIDDNNQHISAATPNPNHHGNISFNAGAGYLFSETNSTEIEKTYLFNTTVDTSFATEIGAFVNGLGGTGEVTFETGITIGKSSTSAAQTETTISYVLADDDETSNLNELADYYTVDIKKDPMYGTPVFNLVAGATSNPWEPNTRPRDGVSFMANTNNSLGLLEGQQAVFLLTLGNTTQNFEARRYYLSMHHESNPGGATVLINGLPLIDRMAFDIDAGSSVQAVLTINQGPLAYDYPGLTLEFYAEGDRGNDGPTGHDFWQNQSFNVSWETPYSKVSIANPGPDWQINQAANNALEIMLANYDISKANFRSLVLQYKRPSSVNWSQGFEIVRDSLIAHPHYIIADWNVSGLGDGEYQIRAGATDNIHASYYSDYITGYIDRSSPAVWGLPQPSDGVLQLGDIISLTFTEDIDPNSLMSASIALRKISTDTVVDANVQVNGPSVSIVPNVVNSWLENETFDVKVSGLKDLCGNTMIGEVVWEFYVNANPVSWIQPKLEIIKPLGQAMQITTYLNNSGGQTSSFSITGLPDWLTVNTANGTLLPMDSQTLVFTVSNQLGYGTFRTTVYADIPALGIEPLLFEISVLANPPAWATTQLDNYQYSMTITGQLMMEGGISTDTNDIIGAFVLGDNNDYVCRGYANLRSAPYLAGAYQFFLTVNSDEEDAEELYFRVWDSSTSKEHYGITEAYVFSSGAVYGTPLTPVILNVSPTLFRSIPCRSGWNWVSVNLLNPASMAVNDVLSSLTPADNDLIKNQTAFAQYTSGSGWVGNLNNIASTEMLKIKLSSPDDLQIIGNLEPPLTTPINHGSGWNWIGYLPHVSISVTEALANMSATTTGDLIKNQTGYSQYIDGYGWFGSLLFMDAGQGYMLKTNSAGSFTYPNYVIPREQLADLNAAPESNLREPDGWLCNPLSYEYSSNITAEIHDHYTLLNDQNIMLAAFYGDECRGIATAVRVLDQWVFFLTQYSNVMNQELSYKVYLAESNEIIDAVETLPFINNQILGNPLDPYTFNINMGALNAPQNLALAIDGNTLNISWDAVAGAMSYKIYAGDSPDGEFTDVSSLGYFTRTESSTNLSNASPDRATRLMWSCDIPEGQRKFYHIKASTDMP